MDEVIEGRKYIRVEPSDPNRCTSIAINGDQCVFQAAKDPRDDTRFTEKCHLHGHFAAARLKKEAKKLYFVDKYRARIDRLSDPETGTNLDEELGILRMMLEEVLNKYSDIELITQSGQVTAIIRDIRDTLVANKKLKSAMGELLDRGTMNRLCDQLLLVMSKYVPTDKLDLVSASVAEAIATAVANRMGD